MLTQLGLAALRRLEEGVDEVGADRVAQLEQAAAGDVGEAVGRQPQPEPELGVVLNSELDHAGPRPFAPTVHGVVGRLPP